MTLLELILSEIPEKASARPAERGGQENSSARGQKIPPPKPLHFLPTRWKKFFANCKIIQNKEAVQDFTLAPLLISQPLGYSAVISSSPIPTPLSYHFVFVKR